MTTFKPVPYLFPQTSRAQTPNAPPYDGTRKVKSWVDPNPGPGPDVTYTMVNANGAVVNVHMPVTEASTLNLPGHPDYPHYAPAKSGATFAQSNIPIPFGVATLADAEALAAALGLANDAIFDEMASFPGSLINYPADDPRRAYGIKFSNGNGEEVARLLAARNANGVSSPGEWKQDAKGNWAWVSEPASDTATTDIMPVPIAPLKAGEQIIVGPFGPVLASDDGSAAPSGEAGGFTDADRADLKGVVADIKRVVAWIAKVGG